MGIILAINHNEQRKIRQKRKRSNLICKGGKQIRYKGFDNWDIDGKKRCFNNSIY